MIDVAVALTRDSRSIGAPAIARLRAHGFDDVAIHQIVQITALFNYYNRLVDGLGGELEPEWGEDPLAPGRRGGDPAK
jgi:alkylhydroperoxidase family enzyme